MQLKSYDDKTRKEIGNVLPITNSEAVKVENDKNLKQKLTEINAHIEQTNSSLDKINNNTKTIIHNVALITDYTNIINNAFIKGGIIEFEAGEYRITNTIYIDTEKVKKVIGNNAILLMENEDEYIRELVIEGHLQGSAPPDQTAVLLKEKMLLLKD